MTAGESLTRMAGARIERASARAIVVAMPEPRRIEIRLLGPFRARVDGIPVEDRLAKSRKAQVLLQVLAVSPRHRLHREQVCEVLWPHLNLSQATNQLYKALHTARRALEPGLPPRGDSRFLRSAGCFVELTAPGGVWVDADAFELAAESALRQGSAALAEEALVLYGGDLLPDELYADWAAARRERLRRLRLELLVQAARHDSRACPPERALALWRRVLAVDKAHEDAHRAVMEILAATGRRQEALRQFRECQEALRRELDAEPDVRTRVLYERLAATPGPSLTPEEPDRATSVECTMVGRRRARVVERPARILAALGGLVRGLRPRGHGRLRRYGFAAAVVMILQAALFLPGSEWVARKRYRVGRTLAKAGGAAAAWAGSEPRLLTIRGRLSSPGVRVEVLDSVSGVAAFPGPDGTFVLPSAVWYPADAYTLVLSSAWATGELIEIGAPPSLPVDSVLDVGEVRVGAGRQVSLHGLYGLNATSYVAYDVAGDEYYRGVFYTLTTGCASEDAEVEAVFRHVAGCYRDSAPSPGGQAPRDTLRGGTRWSGDLAVAMATLVRAGGYDVRLVSMLDLRDAGRAHCVVEVYHGGRWHLYDPAFGVLVRSPEGGVAGYEDLRRNPELIPVEALAGLRRTGWTSHGIASLYASGIHQYVCFIDPSTVH